jgi:hypothetical protein
MDDHRVNLTQTKGLLSLCCADVRNRRVLQEVEGHMQKQECVVCGRGHYVMKGDLGRLNAIPS